MYAAIFPHTVSAPPARRNTLLATLTSPECCNPVGSPEIVCGTMIGQLRMAYARHVGDPAWTHFIRDLEALSPAFAKAWAAHDVAIPAAWVKAFRHPGLGMIRVTSTSFAVSAVPGARMVVYTPTDDESRIALDKLADGEAQDAHFPCWPTHAPATAEAAAVTA
jgi:hypothetical protein